MKYDAPRFLGLALSAVMACSGCVGGRGHSFQPDEIRAVLDRQASAWNRGDIATFMEAYDRSSRLTFSSSGKVTRGWQPTLDNYYQRYPTREAMGHLTFSELEFTKLGDAAALVLGRWDLDRGNPVGGVFTLLFRRESGRWVIIHDHTSRTPPASSNGSRTSH